jgi:hypothetical protein
VPRRPARRAGSRRLRRRRYARSHRHGRCRRGAGAGCAIASLRAWRWIGYRGGRPGDGARHRDGAVVRQPVAPILEPRAQRLPQQQRAEARAVDEQVGRQLRAVGQRHALDEAGFGVQADLDHPPLDTDHPCPLGMAAQESGIERRVEMKGIADLGERRITRLGSAEAPRHRRGGADRIGGERLGLARLVEAAP